MGDLEHFLLPILGSLKARLGGLVGPCDKISPAT